MTSLYLIEPRTRRRAPAAPECEPLDDWELDERCSGGRASPYIVTERDKAEFAQMLDDYEASISIPPSPSDLLRERVSRADWSIFDSADDRAIAPRGRVVRAGLVAMMLAALAALAAEVFVR